MTSTIGPELMSRDREPKIFTLRGFQEPRHPEAVQRKLNEFREAIALHKASVGIDLDKTLTSQHSRDSFELAAEAYRESAGRRRSDVRRAYHKGLQRRGLLSDSAMRRWTILELGDHMLNGTDTAMLKKVIADAVKKNEMQLRGYGKEFISTLVLNQDKVSSYIVSAGNGHIAEALLQFYGIDFPIENVISNFMGQDPHEVVNASDKRTHFVRYFPQADEHQERCTTIAFGDHTTDAVMAGEYGLAICTSHTLDADGLFDLRLATEDLEPMVNLFGELFEPEDDFIF